MIGLGDELGRTQGGNNNAYCHDSELTWLGWSAAEADQALLDFAESVCAIRREHEVLRRDEWPGPRVVDCLAGHTLCSFGSSTRRSTAT